MYVTFFVPIACKKKTIKSKELCSSCPFQSKQYLISTQHLAQQAHIHFNFQFNFDIVMLAFIANVDILICFNVVVLLLMWYKSLIIIQR